MNLKVVLVEKTGELRNLQIKNFEEDMLYKKCGFKVKLNFQKQTEWKIVMNNVQYTISLFAKSEGRQNKENKYEFPPPFDTQLLFGCCALVARDDKSLVDLTCELWKRMYDKLYGGFEDLSEITSDDSEEDELDLYSPSLKTKEGYLKDDFVVDNEESSYISNNDELTFEPYL